MSIYKLNKKIKSLFLIFSIGFFQTSDLVASLASQEELDEKKNKTTVRILSVDGGGTRGIVPATILAAIEQETGKKISEIFDIVGGTSIGAVLTTYLTVRENPDDKNSGPKFSAKDACDIFYTEGPTIFSKRRIPIPSVYGNGIETVLEKILGDTTYDQTTIPRVAVAFNVISLSTKVFSSADSKELFAAKDVALSSAAFPVEFAPRFVSPKNLNEQFFPQYFLVDGGLTANDPVAYVMEEARKIYPNTTQFEVVSLGNGIVKDSWTNSIFKTGLSIPKIFWRLFDVTINLVAYEPNFYFSKILGDHYIRLNPSISANNTSAVNAEKTYFDGLQNDVRNYLSENKESFSALIEKLKTPRS